MLENELSSTRKQLHNLEQTTETRVSNRLQQHSKALEERFENIQMDRADALMAAQSLKRQLKSLKLSSQVQKDNLVTKSRVQQRKISEMKEKILDLSERVRCPPIGILFGTYAFANGQLTRCTAACVPEHATWRARTRTPAP